MATLVSPTTPTNVIVLIVQFIDKLSHVLSLSRVSSRFQQIIFDPNQPCFKFIPIKFVVRPLVDRSGALAHPSDDPSYKIDISENGSIITVHANVNAIVHGSKSQLTSPTFAPTSLQLNPEYLMKLISCFPDLQSEVFGDFLVQFLIYPLTRIVLMNTMEMHLIASDARVSEASLQIIDSLRNIESHTVNVQYVSDFDISFRLGSLIDRDVKCPTRLLFGALPMLLFCGESCRNVQMRLGDVMSSLEGLFVTGCTLNYLYFNRYQAIDHFDTGLIQQFVWDLSNFDANSDLSKVVACREWLFFNLQQISKFKLVVSGVSYDLDEKYAEPEYSDGWSESDEDLKTDVEGQPKGVYIPINVSELCVHWKTIDSRLIDRVEIDLSALARIETIRFMMDSEYGVDAQELCECVGRFLNICSQISSSTLTTVIFEFVWPGSIETKSEILTLVGEYLKNASVDLVPWSDSTVHRNEFVLEFQTGDDSQRPDLKSLFAGCRVWEKLNERCDFSFC